MLPRYRSTTWSNIMMSPTIVPKICSYSTWIPLYQFSAALIESASNFPPIAWVAALGW